MKLAFIFLLLSLVAFASGQPTEPSTLRIRNGYQFPSDEHRHGLQYGDWTNEHAVDTDKDHCFVFDESSSDLKSPDLRAGDLVEILDWNWNPGFTAAPPLAPWATATLQLPRDRRIKLYCSFPSIADSRKAGPSDFDAVLGKAINLKWKVGDSFEDSDPSYRRVAAVIKSLFGRVSYDAWYSIYSDPGISTTPSLQAIQGTWRLLGRVDSPSADLDENFLLKLKHKDTVKWSIRITGKQGVTAVRQADLVEQAASLTEYPDEIFLTATTLNFETREQAYKWQQLAIYQEPTVKKSYFRFDIYPLTENSRKTNLNTAQFTCKFISREGVNLLICHELLVGSATFKLKIKLEGHRVGYGESMILLTDSLIPAVKSKVTYGN